MEPFIAEIILFAGNFAPRGWAFCDGQLLEINQNQSLFSILGTTYGGDGRTTFALPDLRGRVPMHFNEGPGLSKRKIGEKGGSEQNTIAVDQLPAHQHIEFASESANTDVIDGNYLSGTGSNVFSSTTNVQMNANAVANTGGGKPLDNVQPFACLNYIIATQGLFPSRN